MGGRRSGLAGGGGVRVSFVVVAPDVGSFRRKREIGVWERVRKKGSENLRER